ncbi:MAG TPA: hypothetical protein VHK67_05935, partial [Rhabdochlamydiaceae bacterium]|nr:hypothetical protein [Rhabdochlamydiaceae bacterium]
MTSVQPCSFRMADHTYTVSFGSSQTLHVEVADASKHTLLLKADYSIDDTSNTLPSTINQLFQRISVTSSLKVDPIIQNDLGLYYEQSKDH